MPLCPLIRPAESEGRRPAQRRAGRMAWAICFTQRPDSNVHLTQKHLRGTPRSTISPRGPVQLTLAIGRHDGRSPNLGNAVNGVHTLPGRWLAVRTLQSAFSALHTRFDEKPYP